MTMKKKRIPIEDDLLHDLEIADAGGWSEEPEEVENGEAEEAEGEKGDRPE